MAMARAHNGGCARLVNARFEGGNAREKFGVNDASPRVTRRRELGAV